MFDWLSRLFRPPPALPVLPVDQLAAAPVRYRWDDGEKYPGGFGPTQLLTADYPTLRARSVQLFETNLYARGLIRRLVTNEINTGLHLEATPLEGVLGFPEDGLADWSELVENRFSIWEDYARLCDHAEQLTFGEIQAAVRSESLIAGDVLCVLLQDEATSLPRVQLISGSRVTTPISVGPFGRLPRGNRVVHGVELDEQGRQVAYWVQKEATQVGDLGTFSRVPAFGDTGRRIAWLVYGTDRRLDQVRGKPMLALILQSLHEIDRYRDAVQRKAVINAVLAMFIEKNTDKPGTKPMTGGAVRRGKDKVVDTTGKERTFNVAEHIPGLVLDELEEGEKPHGFAPTGTDEKFGDFEEAIIQAVAWANEVPPEILRLSFSSNYSASQAAINEFKMYLNRLRSTFGKQFCQTVYTDWLLSEVLNQKIDAPRLLEAFRNLRQQYDVFCAWVSADWTGHIKPAVDQSKLVRGYERMIKEGLITRDRAARELTGTKYSKNVQKLARENAQLAEANKSLVELEQQPSTSDRDDDPEDREDDDREDALGDHSPKAKYTEPN